MEAQSKTFRTQKGQDLPSGQVKGSLWCGFQKFLMSGIQNRDTVGVVGDGVTDPPTADPFQRGLGANGMC